MALNNKDLLKLISKNNLVSKSDLTVAENVSKHLNCLVTDVLLGRGLITENELGNILSTYYKIPFINLNELDIQIDFIKLI